MALRPKRTEARGGAVDDAVLIDLPDGADEAAGMTGEEGEEDAPQERERPRRRERNAPSLKDQLDAAQNAARIEREQRQNAERAANQLAMEAEAANRRAQSLEGDVINTGLRSVQSDLAAAESEYTRAAEAGDFAGQAKAQTKIARATAQMVSLESGAAEIAERRPAPRQQQAAQPQQRQMSWSDQVQANPNLLDSEKRWMLDNERSFRDPDFNRKLEYAYQGAQTKGLARGSDEYFEHIEKATGLADGRDYDAKGIPMAAPVRRQERGYGGRRTSDPVRLSPAQQEIIESLAQYGVTAEEYARQQRAFDATWTDDPDEQHARYKSTNADSYSKKVKLPNVY